MLGTTLSRASVGVAAPLVEVEVHTGGGLPRFTLVGMPEVAVREARERVRSAITHTGFAFPDGHITVHLAPAELPKQGGRYDLAIAIGILAASQQIPQDSTQAYEFFGELSLAGALRATPGLLPAVLAAEAAGHRVFAPAANKAELAIGFADALYMAADLATVTAHLSGREVLPNVEPSVPKPGSADAPDFADVVGQVDARRALEVAAAGQHNVLMIGPPGSGKSMLAERFIGILPLLTRAEALELAAVRSVLGRDSTPATFFQRPFRAPHHTASAAALVGGQSPPKPGEVSLAHHGVLFVDEIAEVPRRVLDVLREPIEAGHIAISRAGHHAEFPARFQLLAAMNPCPCGYYGDADILCRCSPDQIRNYRGRLSGPLLDRIDIQLHVPRMDIAEFTHGRGGEASAAIAKRVQLARQRAQARSSHLNAQIESPLQDDACQLDVASMKLLTRAATELHLSPRGVTRTLRVARTIADLACCEQIGRAHLAEALALRATCT